MRIKPLGGKAISNWVVLVVAAIAGMLTGQVAETLSPAEALGLSIIVGLGIGALLFFALKLAGRWLRNGSDNRRGS